MKAFSFLGLTIVILTAGFSRADEPGISREEKMRINDLNMACQIANPAFSKLIMEAEHYFIGINMRLHAKKEEVKASNQTTEENASQLAFAALNALKTPNRGRILMDDYNDFYNAFYPQLKNETGCVKITTYFHSLVAKSKRIMCQFYELEGSEKQHRGCEEQLNSES